MRPWIVPFSHGWTKEGLLDVKYEQTVEGKFRPSQADLFSFFAREDYEIWRCLEGYKTEHHCAPLLEAGILKVERSPSGIVLVLRYGNGEIGKLFTSDVHRVHDTITIPRNLIKQYWDFCSKLELLRRKHIQDHPKPTFMGKYGYSKLPPLMLSFRESELSSEWIFHPRIEG